MKFIADDGQEYEFQRYGVPHKGDHLISLDGVVVLTHTDFSGIKDYTIVSPVRKEYVLGGIKFVGTGKIQPPKANEWYEDAGDVYLARSDFHTYGFPILKPVEVL